MKIFYTLLITIWSIAVSAQNENFAKQDEKMYGTPAEKAHQDDIARQSNNRFLSRLVGFKMYYADNLSTYLQMNMDYSLGDAPDSKGYFTEILTKKGVYIGKIKPPKMVLKFAIDKDERIKSGVINGRFADLANLFINYWPMSAEWNSEVQLKPGVAAQKHCFGDLITFNWVGATPFIKVTKDANISFPVPPLKQ
ncbi:hypothetical protein [Mucilaginibacter sp.]|uniref:hypothetical protein n=1 Tax=Mucilaginibacter sp. TaxID=1882438 RepID=UPI0025D71F9F|nr:hypothetical protein [Mucilaginibacter sp.]